MCRNPRPDVLCISNNRVLCKFPNSERMTCTCHNSNKEWDEYNGRHMRLIGEVKHLLPQDIYRNKLQGCTTPYILYGRLWLMC